MSVHRINASTFAGMPPEGVIAVGLGDGLIGRVFGLPPELLPACGQCGAATAIDGEIDNKYIDYKNLGANKPARVRAWCIGHVPQRIWLRDWLKRVTNRPYPRLHPETLT